MPVATGNWAGMAVWPETPFLQLLRGPKILHLHTAPLAVAEATNLTTPDTVEVPVRPWFLPQLSPSHPRAEPVSQGIRDRRKEPTIPVMTGALAEARLQEARSHKKQQQRHRAIPLTQKMEAEKCELSNICNQRQLTVEKPKTCVTATPTGKQKKGL